MNQKKKNTPQRTIRTAKELDQMRENAKVHKEVFDAIKSFVKPGINAMQVDELCGKIAKQHDMLCGFKGVYNFPGNICINVNNCVVHGIPSKKIVFKDGDVVTFDFGIKDKILGLNTDAAFTMIVGDGPHDPEVERFLRVSEEALYKGIAKAVPGNRTGDIGHAVQKHIESHGYHIIKELTGHAIGYKLHEKPYIPNYGTPGTGEMLKENMTIAIEPIVGFSTGYIKDLPSFAIYMADDSLGCQFEHTIVVKPGYPEIII